MSGQSLFVCFVMTQSHNGSKIKSNDGSLFLDNKFHVDSSFTILYSNTLGNGGYLINGFCKILKQEIMNREKEKDLHEMIVDIRRQVKYNSGINNNGNITQCVDFRDTLEWHIYFGVNEFNRAVSREKQSQVKHEPDAANSANSLEKESKTKEIKIEAQESHQSSLTRSINISKEEEQEPEWKKSEWKWTLIELALFRHFYAFVVQVGVFDIEAIASLLKCSSTKLTQWIAGDDSIFCNDSRNNLNTININDLRHSIRYIREISNTNKNQWSQQMNMAVQMQDQRLLQIYTSRTNVWQSILNKLTQMSNLYEQGKNGTTVQDIEILLSP